MTRLCLTVLALALWAFNAYDCQPLQDSELSRSELQTQVVNFDHEDDDEEYLNDEAEDEVLAALEDVQHHSNNNLKSRKLPLQRTRTYAKAVIREGASLPIDQANFLEAEAFAASFTTEDRREGMAAFLEKREAQFKGA